MCVCNYIKYYYKLLSLILLVLPGCYDNLSGIYLFRLFSCYCMVALWLYLYIIIYIYIYILWRVSCLPLIISISPSLNRRLHQAPDGSGCVREEGRWKQPGLAACDEHTWSEWSLITAAVYAELRLSSGDRSLSPCMHAGVLVGPGRERWGIECRTRETADGPRMRAV